MTARAFLAVSCVPLALALGPDSHARLDAGGAVVELLPSEGKDVALQAAVVTTAPPSRLGQWMRRIEEVQDRRYAVAVGRFSSPPRIEDLSALTLDDHDLASLERCRPGHCDVKLDAGEIARIQRVFDGRGDWQSRAQHTFREIVLARAIQYESRGHGPWTTYQDDSKPVQLDAEFAAVASAFALEQPQLFALTNYLSLYPRAAAAEVESFLYWSKDALGAKPIVSITHVAMAETYGRRAAAIVAKKQVYASHYLLSSLSFTAIVPSPSGSGFHLIYMNRTRSDVFGGMFGGLIRRTIARRLRAEAPQALDGLRRRLESGPPPDAVD